jgi:hypothetical protein
MNKSPNAAIMNPRTAMQFWNTRASGGDLACIASHIKRYVRIPTAITEIERTAFTDAPF